MSRVQHGDQHQTASAENRRRQNPIRQTVHHALRLSMRQALLIALPLCMWATVANTVVGQLNSAVPQTIQLDNGMRFTGRLGSIRTMTPTAANISANTTDHGIILADDELRKIFVSKRKVSNFVDAEFQEEEFEIWQPVKRGDGEATVIGPTIRTGKFDLFGRRLVTIDGPRGAITVLQGITRVNPRFVEIQGLINNASPQAPERTWNIRLSTTSVPTSVLVSILERQIRNPGDSRERLRLVDFYVQAGMYRQAEETLQAIRNDFSGLKDEYRRQSELLRSQIDRQALAEANLRLESGQPALASLMLKPLMDSVDTPVPILVEIGEIKNKLQAALEQIEQTKKTTLDLTQRLLAAKDTNAELRQAIEIFVQEIQSDLSINNVDRLSTFMRFADDVDQTDEQKISLALGGWVAGPGFNPRGIAESTSLLRTRGLVIEYLSTSRPDRRLEILAELETIETGAPSYLDQIVKQIKPPLAPSQSEISTLKPMEFEIEIPARAGRPPHTSRFLVQLPPEYDPYRRYPCILTLGGGTVDTSPAQQIDFWAGPAHPRLGLRTGKASGHGYIVIAPDWIHPSQPTYNYTHLEHAVVLKSLREAIRRFSIDTDRVFLTGHFAGANAAWDIGQAHPEHWAGVIPISARIERYIKHYHSNGKSHFKWYFVNGGRDFPSLQANASIWNKQMISGDFDTIIVYFRGRGTERFSDELPNIFQWMSPQRRQFNVQEFKCATLRPWDNYFWWLDADLWDNPKMIFPEMNWDRIQRSNWDVEGKVDSNTFTIKGVGDSGTIWLSPQIVDFSLNIEIRGNSGKFKGGVQPSRKTLLEDVRTRSDRQHPYWAKIVRRKKVWAVEE